MRLGFRERDRRGDGWMDGWMTIDTLGMEGCFVYEFCTCR